MEFCAKYMKEILWFVIDSLAERLAINFTSIVTRNEIDPADASKRPSYRMEPKAAAVSSYELGRYTRTTRARDKLWMATLCYWPLYLMCALLMLSRAIQNVVKKCEEMSIHLGPNLILLVQNKVNLRIVLFSCSFCIQSCQLNSPKATPSKLARIMRIMMKLLKDCHLLADQYSLFLSLILGCHGKTKTPIYVDEWESVVC